MSKIDLSAHELELMKVALPYAQEVKSQDGRYPTREELRIKLSCRDASAGRIQRFIQESDAGKVAIRLEANADRADDKAIVQFAQGDLSNTSLSSHVLRENATLQRRLARMSQELKAEKEMRRHLSENHAGADDLLKNVKDFVQSMGDFSSPVTKVKAQKPQAVPPVREGHTEDAVLVISDTHFGDVIRNNDTSGFPEYDLEIAGNRFGYIAKKTKVILGLHRAMYPIKRLIVPILGDIGNGDLHDAPKSNSLFIAPQIHFSYHMIRFMIEDLLTLIDEGIIEEIVLLFSVGNHMRMMEDHKMPTKLQAQRTFDWLIYQFVMEKFRGVKGITIRDTMSPFIFENIRGHRYGFNHGCEVGYRNTPEAQAKSITAFINKTRALFDSPIYREHAGLEGATFDRFVIGDIHVPVSFPRLLSNGSLNGQNELGVNWGLEVIPAGQWLFGVSDKQIQTWQYLLDCTHIQRQNPNGYAIFAKDYLERFGRA